MSKRVYKKGTGHPFFVAAAVSAAPLAPEPERPRRPPLQRKGLLVVMGFVLVSASGTQPARGEDHRPPTAAIAGHPIQRPDPSTRSAVKSASGWWLGPAGVVLLLGVVASASWAARRYQLLPAREAGWLEVVGRVPLSPRHTVYAVRAGDRMLIVGTGAGGAPTLLANWPGSETPITRPGGGS